ILGTRGQLWTRVRLPRRKELLSHAVRELCVHRWRGSKSERFVDGREAQRQPVPGWSRSHLALSASARTAGRARPSARLFLCAVMREPGVEPGSLAAQDPKFSDTARAWVAIRAMRE